jgi:hypothetical protein
MSVAGVQGFRSALQGSEQLEIPDLRTEQVRARWADDHWSPGR